MGLFLNGKARISHDGAHHFGCVKTAAGLQLTTDSYGRSLKRDSSYIVTNDHQFLRIGDIILRDHNGIQVIELICSTLVVELFVPYDPAMTLCDIDNSLCVEHIVKLH